MNKRYKHLCCLINYHTKCRDCVKSTCRDHADKIRWMSCSFCIVEGNEAKPLWMRMHSATKVRCVTCHGKHTHVYKDIEVAAMHQPFDRQKQAFGSIEPRQIKRATVKTNGDSVYIMFAQSSIVRKVKDLEVYPTTARKYTGAYGYASDRWYIFLGLRK